MVRPKKSLGQHFLHSPSALQTMVEASQIFPGDLVLEIGPGEGVLTEALLNAGARVIAVEKDTRCIGVLNERFYDALRDEHLIVIEGDILDKHMHDRLFEGILAEAPSYKVVANIPYYITGALFRLFLETTHQPSLITFLVQKEVGEQIAGKGNKESILSLSVKIFGDPALKGIVPRSAFTPPPKVDSAILTITNIGRTRLSDISETDFFHVVKAGFRAKRKMLLGNLAEGLTLAKEVVEQGLTASGIEKKARAEDVHIPEWIQLTQSLTTNKKDPL